MNVRQLNVFGEAGLDNSIKFAVARDLERLYSPLLTEPIPPNLRSYIDRLGQAIGQATESERLLGVADRRVRPGS
jgi:hypothetical protein